GQFMFSIEELPEIPPIFELIKTTGDIKWQEMFTTFNMGIGLVVVVPSSQVDQALSALSRNDKAYRLGVIEKSKKGVVEIKPYEVRIE
ncbi:MAG: hypothetical protein KAR03_03650, partial [Candidatus Thorarchaeota archaeon]|nr:hypothetical protein [Candidatus Thorarchaeota archaeon]